MPISVIKGNFYDGPIDSFLTLFVDAYYYNSYSGSGTTVIDLSGDNDGTLSNVTFDVEQGGSFVFGNNSYIDFLNNQNNYNTGDLTICALVKPTQDNMGPNGGPIISVDSFDDGSNYLALVYGTSLYPGKFSWIQRQGTSGPVNVPSNTLCPSNDWYFITITRSQSTGKTKMYINGVLDREDESGTTLPTYNLRVGRNQVKTPSGQFLGKISSIRIFIRELSQSEIVNIYNNLRLPPKTLGKSNYSYEPSQNLMVYSNRSLHVDAGEPNSYYISGSTFSDLTGRGINGTLTNSFSGTNPTFSQFNGGYFNFNGFKTTNPSNPDQTGNSFIEFNADQLPSGSATSSVITWARCSGYSRANRYIFSYGNPGSAQARYLGVTTITGKFLVGGWGPASELVSNASVSLDEWFQLTFVYTGSSILIYVNGVLDNSKPYTLSTVTTNKKARIGRQITTNGASVDNADGYWYGDISEVIVYDRVLDPQEIYQDYKVKRYRYGLGEVERPIDNAVPTTPSVTTITISNITTTSASSGVQVDSNGNSNITVSGVIWSTLTNPTTALGTKTTNGTGNITGLSPGVTYYVRAYATNAVGTSYGQQETFTSTPIVLPSVIAITASYTGDSAFATGSVTGLGNATSVSARGFVWSISTINQNTADSITTTRVTESGPFVTGEYGLTISPLTPNTTYYVRAFATNTANTSGTTNTPGTTYSSEQLVFKTYAFATVTVPIITNITGISFDASITTTGQLITRQGIIWKTVNTPPNVLADLNNTQPGPAGTYPSTIGSQVNPNTTYYVYGYVENIAGIAYSTVQTVVTDNFALITTDPVDTNNVTNISATVSGSLDNTNGSTVTAIGFVWGDELNFSDPIDLDINNKTGIYTKTTGIVLGAFNHKITGLSEVTSYYVKAYATNAVGTSYGDAQLFTTFGTPQISTLNTVPGTITDQYILTGNIFSLGGYSPVEVGFEYYVTSTPLSVITVVSSTTQTVVGTFIKKLTLSPSTNYTVRAYLKCPLGTFYGSPVTFTTQASTQPPTVSLSTTLNVGSNFISLSGNITDSGGESILERGFYYSTSPNVTTSSTKVIVTGFAGDTGTYQWDVTGLIVGTTYYFRAFARNSAGTGLSTSDTQATTLTIKFVRSSVANGDVNGDIYTNNNEGFLSDPVHQGSGSSTIIQELVSVSFNISASDNQNFSPVLIYGSYQTNLPTSTNNNASKQYDIAINSFNFVRASVQLPYQLGAGNIWYFRAFYTNNLGVGKFSNVLSIYFPALYGVTVTQLSPTSISVEGRVDLTNAGSLTITEKGYYISNVTSTFNVYEPYFNTSNRTKVPVGGTTPGAWTNTRTGLVNGQSYAVMAYVTLSNGITYWSEYGAIQLG